MGNEKYFGNLEKNIICVATNGFTIILNTSYPLVELISVSVPNPSTMSSDISQLNLTQYEQRLVTYMNKWEFNFITPSQMAKAGFYYTGTEDRVKCLFCSIEFGSWDRDDDPLEKHKQLSPRCPFFSQEDDQGKFQ